MINIFCIRGLAIVRWYRGR